MRRSRLRSRVATWLLMVPLAACGGDDDARSKLKDAGSGVDAAMPDAAEPISGLKSRPENTGCVAHATPPQQLSETGCFALVTEVGKLVPSPFTIAYDVAVPLWSDAADKARFFALPQDAELHVQDDGDFELPAGAVTIKTFSLDDKPIETRLLVRKDDGEYDAYSYVWNENGTEAELALDGADVKVGDQTWHVPSRKECWKCHTEAAGISLGLEAVQLDTDMLYERTGRVANQLDTLAAIGVLDAKIPDDVREHALPATSDDDVSLETRAKAYLHANCAICHRPGGQGFGEIDLRFDTPFDFMGLCDELPMHDDGDLEDARLLAPGAPERSLLSARMRSRGSRFAMPPLASDRIDDAGIAAVEAWIESIEACPSF